MVDHAVDVSWGHRIGVIREDNLLGDEYTKYPSRAGAPRGVSVVADVPSASFIDAEAGLAAVSRDEGGGRRRPTCTSASAPPHSQYSAPRGSWQAEGYDAARITMSIFMGTIEGLASRTTGLIDQLRGLGRGRPVRRAEHDFTAMLDRFEKRFGTAPGALLHRAGLRHGQRRRARAGPGEAAFARRLRRGLETVRRVDAAAGGPGNHISFGP